MVEEVINILFTCLSTLLALYTTPQKQMGVFVVV